MVKQTCMLLPAVLHVLPTQFNKITLIDVPSIVLEVIPPALLCTNSMCDYSSLIQLSKTISEYSKPGL